MAGTYLDINTSTGRPKREQALTSSAGAGDAGKIPSLDGSGKLDATFLPDMASGEDLTLEALEAITAGQLINTTLSGGVLKVRKADGTDPTREADGYANATISSGASGSIHVGPGTLVKTGHGLTIGARVFLGATPGALVTTALTTAGYISQRVGKVLDDNQIIIDFEEPIEL